MQKLNFKCWRWYSLILLVLAVPLLTHCGDPVQPSGVLSYYTFDYTVLSRPVGAVHLSGSLWGNRFDVEGDVAVVAVQFSGFSLLDLSNPREPRETLQVEWKEHIIDVHLKPSILYVLDIRALHLVDRQAPGAAPLGTFTFPENVTPKFMLLSRTCIIAVHTQVSDFLWFVDIGDPENIHKVAQISISGRIQDMALDGDLLLVGTSQGVVLMDIAKPQNLKVWSGLARGPHVAIADGFAYVSGFVGGSSDVITVVDVRDPGNPVEISSTPTPRGGGPMVVQGDRLYVRLGHVVEVINVADRWNPEVEGSIPSPYVGWMKVRGSRMWTLGTDFVEYETGEGIAAPAVGYVEQTYRRNNFQLENGRIFSLDDRGLFAVNVRDPQRINPAVFFPGEYGGLVNFHVDGTRLYLSKENQIEIRNLSSGHLLGTLTLHDRIRWIAGNTDYLYVVVTDVIDRSYDLLVIDVSNPKSPLIVGRVTCEGDPVIVPQSFQLVKSQLFILSYDGLAVFDVSHPLKPRILSKLSIEGAENMTNHEGFVYVYTETFSAESARNLKVIDARDLTQLRVVSQLPIQWRPSSMVAQGNVLYMLTVGGMSVFDISFRTSPKLVGAHGFTSDNSAIALFAGEGVLYAVQSNSLSVLPVHAVNR